MAHLSLQLDVVIFLTKSIISKHSLVSSRGALDARASDITEEMQIAAARGIASIIPDDELSVENIIPNAFNPNVSKIVAKSVNKAAE